MVEFGFESFFFYLNIGKERVKLQMSLPIYSISACDFVKPDLD